MNPRTFFYLALMLSANCQAAIIYPKAPDGGRQIIHENLNPKFLGISRIEDVTIANPYQEYFVGPTNLAFGKLLSSATPGGWRYLLIYGTNAVGAVRLIADEKAGKALQFAGLHETDFSNETLAALRMAEQLPQIKKQDYEVRRLESPSIYFVAIWLHGKSDDIIIPLPPTFGRWNAYQLYSESQMIKLMKPGAEQILKQPRLLR
jgi:hypothetical protein